MPSCFHFIRKNGFKSRLGMGLNLSKVVFDEWKKNRIDKYDISDFDENLSILTKFTHI